MLYGTSVESESSKIQTGYFLSEIHNQWLKAVNVALQRDRHLTDKVKFGPLALKKQLVLNTWSGLLIDEDSLPED